MLGAAAREMLHEWGATCRKGETNGSTLSFYALSLLDGAATVPSLSPVLMS
ncbi:hypothetical protein Pla86_34800 [Planctomycetes bacterium Pla86]|uniref:Uncharacterized protein n=1 Tax=Engelhardtia mirabilis TaxID=2528011 RepID=A0A518BN58_9BACT|nr:hypothetical protein Pla133_34820 [Planctomycetes bacterium Pla133]QDV02711.1 hypothetical protein Pla86_34800 [Planctomycetes bacterium Pla86]